MEQPLNLPKKLLKIADLTFELPDDFEGDFKSALQLLLNYLTEVFGDKDIDPATLDSAASIFEDPQKRKLLVRFGIFERGDDGNYYLK